jgi:RNA polymerase sigma factor (sigma-70 family)
MASDSANPIDPLALLAQTGWVARLAAGLLRDPQDVDDLVQDVFVAALERPPTSRDEAGLRAWLAAVTRNLAGRGRRRRARRRDVELHGARGEAVGGGQDAVARMEVQRLLAESVLALHEPYREAVVLRHLDGLSAQAIAQRQGITAEAARQRVARGLAHLREQLDRRHGGRRAVWSTLLVPLLETPPGALTASGALLTGGGLVATKTVWIAASAVAMVAGAWFARTAWQPAAPAQAPSEALVASEPPVAAPAGDAEAREDEPKTSARTQVATGTAARVTGSVRDSFDRPVEGAQLTLELQGAPLEDLRASSDAGGLFRIEAPSAAPGEPLELLVAHADYLSARVSVPPSRECAVILAGCPRLEVRLVDAEGRPARGPGRVEVRVRDGDGRKRRVQLDRGADEVWRSSGLTESTLVEVSARVRGFAQTSQELERPLQADQVVALEVVLAPGRVVRGVVKDSATLLPLSDALVWAESYGFSDDDPAPAARTDHAGRFELRGTETAFTHTVEHGQLVYFRLGASHVGHVTLSFATFGAHEAGSSSAEPDFELLLEPATCSFEARVTRAEDGAPVEGYWVYGDDAQRNMIFKRTDAQGRFRIEGLASGALGLTVWPGPDAAEGRRSALTYRTELGPGEQGQVELVLEPEATLVGRVLDLASRPVSGQVVRVAVHHQGPALSFSAAEYETRTALDGSYAFGSLPALWTMVSIGTDDGYSSRPASRWLVLPAGRETRVDFERAPGVAIAGTARRRDGGPTDAYVLLADLTDGAEIERVRPDADGAFRFENVFPTAYELRLMDGDTVIDRATVSANGAGDVLLRAP